MTSAESRKRNVKVVNRAGDASDWIDNANLHPSRLLKSSVVHYKKTPIHQSHHPLININRIWNTLYDIYLGTCLWMKRTLHELQQSAHPKIRKWRHPRKWMNHTTCILCLVMSHVG